MDKYEISIWDSKYDSTSGVERFVEEKIATIGSDQMLSDSRAREPKLVQNINGTNTFSFKILTDYIDGQTGEKVKNPFLKYLVNERRVKVFWKNQWYDLVIKDSSESSTDHSITYTCTDLFINELSKTGFSLEFDTDLENNIGTIEDLAAEVLKDTDWQLGDCDFLTQYVEEPVYEIETTSQFSAYNKNNELVNIPAGSNILLYYSINPSLTVDDGKTFCQFLYSSVDFTTDENEMLVTNGACYYVDITWNTTSAGVVAAFLSGNEIFNLYDVKISTKYRAKRLVRQQKSIYNKLTDRYVNVYNYDGGTENLYGYSETTYEDPITVVNLLVNTSNFSNTEGWINSANDTLRFKIYPIFDKDTDILTYSPTSYLYFSSDSIYNKGLQSNRTYISNGFSNGDIYICRIKAHTGDSDGTTINTNIVNDINAFVPSVGYRDSSYSLISNFTSCINSYYKDGWLEYELRFNQAISYSDLISTSNPIGFFITPSSSYWIEEIQFYKKVIGTDATTGEEVIINPGEMSKQGVVKDTQRYFYSNTTAESEDDIEFLANIDESKLEPVYNNYEQTRTISVKESNRFNILQTLAETFECWPIFEIYHNNNGKITYTDGKADKYVRFVENRGEETSIVFEYGIDLKSVQRTIKSDTIATKTIVLSNDNQYAKNKFCTIARAQSNPTLDTAIYNFDYYINQNLIDANQLYNDLYGTEENSRYLNYYKTLKSYNQNYDELNEELSNLEAAKLKADSSATVYSNYELAAKEELDSIKQDIIDLSGVTDASLDPDKEINTLFDAALVYAKKINSENQPQFEKLQSAINDYTIIKQQYNNYTVQLEELNESISQQEIKISDLEEKIDKVQEDIEELNKKFFVRYSTYIQEGTWSSEEYTDDDLYYLDALQVAYTSSRPQIEYNLSVLRLSALEDFKSKVFNIGDICHIIDREYFGYLSDGITPYKEKVLISEITSNFDSPQNDDIKIQNYTTRFDDLFQRIAAATQSLTYAEGSYAKAANIVEQDGTISSSVIQETFDLNKNLQLNNQTDSVTWDNTGITIKDLEDSEKLLRITSGGLFASADGGETWKNAVRGDGISTNLLSAGSIDTSEISIFKSDVPSFKLDGDGLTAYTSNTDGINLNKFVRFDQYGLYGYDGQIGFVPNSEDSIWVNSGTKFALTWKGFLLHGTDGTGSVTLSDGSDDSATLGLTVKENTNDRVIVGKFLDENNNTVYGINIKDAQGNSVLTTTNNGNLSISGLFDASGGTIGGWNISSGVMSYELLEEAPTDWDNNWYSYYTGNGIDCEKLISSQRPTWESNKYYDSDGNLLAAAPSDWNYNWISYYDDNSKSDEHQLINIKKPTFTSDKFYSGKSTGKIYRGTEGTNNYQELGGAGININGLFKVDPQGNLTATAGTIGGWKITDTSLYRDATTDSGYQYLGEDGIKINDNFSIDSYGNMRIAQDLSSPVFNNYTDETNWKTNWIYTYMKNEDGTYTKTITVKKPTWEANKYYKQTVTASSSSSGNSYTYILQEDETEPTDWSTNWIYYFIKNSDDTYTSLANSSDYIPTYNSTDYYSLTNTGIYIYRDGSIFIGGPNASTANFYVLPTGVMKAQSILGLSVGSGSNVINISSDSSGSASLMLENSSTTNISVTPRFG